MLITKIFKKKVLIFYNWLMKCIKLDTLEIKKIYDRTSN